MANLRAGRACYGHTLFQFHADYVPKALQFLARPLK